MTINGERALITGGAGFVGSHLSRKLLAQGATVHVVDNQVVGRRELVPPEATFHDVDIRSTEFVSTVKTADPDIIFHLAAHHYIPYCNENPEEAFEVNVMGTRRLLDAARHLADLDSVIYASTAAVYPPSHEPHRETDAEGPMDIYGRTKLVGEDLLKLFAMETGISSTAARLFNIYGPRETNDHLIPAILNQIHEGRRKIELGNLTPGRDFIYVEDVTTALIELATKYDGKFRVYNVGTGTEQTVREVVERVSDVLGEEIIVKHAQERSRESDRPNLCASTERIEREIGWQADIEFMEGLRQLLEAEGITA